MNLTGLIGTKLDQTQAFLEDGRRIPLSTILVSGNTVTQIKNEEKDKYSAVQVGFGDKKKVNKSVREHLKKAGIEKTPRFFREIRVADTTGIELGQILNVEEILEPGDVINVTGTSKGKGYAGVVKRHHFKGGPRTHGQSDRERAPGSSGQTTTPGRVYKGKRMSGRMGNETVTIKNLTVIDIQDGIIFIKGLIPGIKGSLVVISKANDNKESKRLKKNYVPLFKEKVESTEAVADSGVAAEEGPVIETVEVEALPEIPTVEEVAKLAEEKLENADKSGISQESDKLEKPENEKSAEPEAVVDNKEVKENA